MSTTPTFTPVEERFAPFTATDVVAQVRREAVAQPDYVSPACQYVSDNADHPICIVGHALHSLGVTLDELFQLEGQNVDDVVIALELADPLDVFDGLDPLVSWLASVQMRQDNGVSWETAVAEADALFSIAVEDDDVAVIS
jgi:hypothetical protein